VPTGKLLLHLVYRRCSVREPETFTFLPSVLALRGTQTHGSDQKNQAWSGAMLPDVTFEDCGRN